MSGTAQFQALTHSIFAEKNYAEKLYAEYLDLFAESAQGKTVAPEVYAISNVLYKSFYLAMTYALPSIYQMEFPQPELPTMVDVNDTAFTNVVPVRECESPAKAQSPTQQIQIPVQLEQLSASGYHVRRFSPDDNLRTHKYERPPSAVEARQLSKQVDAIRAMQKHEKLDVTAMSATRRSDILKQINETVKQGKKIADLPQNYQIVIDENGNVVGVGSEAIKAPQQIGMPDVRQVKKDAKKQEKAPNAPAQKKKEQEQVFADLNRKYEQTLLRTGVVAVVKK